LKQETATLKEQINQTAEIVQIRPQAAAAKPVPSTLVKFHRLEKQ
jgi:hypothetical protein